MENFLKTIWETVLSFFKTVFKTVSGFTLERLLPAILICAAGLLIIVILTKLSSKLIRRTKLENPASSLLMSVIRVALYLLLALIVASSLGIDVTGVIALASVLTLAISLAVQDALSNIIGGFTLICTRPFTVGDFVEIGGQSGTVTNIGLNYTKLLTADRKTISMPNRTIVSSQIINFTVEGTRRVDITINVAYSNDPDAVLEALKKAADIPTVLSDPVPYSAVTGYGDSTVSYLLQVWCSADNYLATLHGVNRNIRTVFREEGIIMTYPHLNVHLDK
jgi:small conductance mechanosensitive channel